MRISVQDESRFGLISVPGRRIVRKGIKAACKKQYNFKSLRLYGIAGPLTGETFSAESPELNKENFQTFMNMFPERHKHCLNIVIGDRSRCHTAQNIRLPDNIVMKFIPPYSPELNPMERLWRSIKDKTSENNDIYKDLKEMRDKISGIISQMSNEAVKNLTFSSYIKEYFSDA